MLKNQKLRYEVEKSEVITIGRNPKSIIKLNDARVSENHCEITWNPNSGATIKDLGSTNGTYIRRNKELILVGRRPDGVPRERAGEYTSLDVPLYSGDCIRLYSECFIDVEYFIYSTQKEMTSKKYVIRSKEVRKAEEERKEVNKVEEYKETKNVEKGRKEILAPTKKRIKLIAEVKKNPLEDYRIQDGGCLVEQFSQDFNMCPLLFPEKGKEDSTTLWIAKPFTDKYTTETIVIKILNLNKSVAKENDRFLFEREKKITPQLDHPNIIKTYKVGKSGNEHYIMMEYCEEGNLAEFVLKNHLRKIMTEKMAIRIIIQVLKGLNYYHNLPFPIEYVDEYLKLSKNSDRKLVHRDIKPANILVRSYDSNYNPEIVICDFGIAKDTTMGGSSGITNNDSDPRATYQFAPCEQVEFPAEVNQGVDIWSTFAVLFWLLTDDLPRDMSGFNNQQSLEGIKEYIKNHPARKIRSLRSDVSTELAELVDSILSRDQNIQDYSNEEELALSNKLTRMI